MNVMMRYYLVWSYFSILQSKFWIILSIFAASGLRELSSSFSLLFSDVNWPALFSKSNFNWQSSHLSICLIFKASYSNKAYLYKSQFVLPLKESLVNLNL